MIRFYTHPPRGVYWPYVFTNYSKYKSLYRLDFEHAILDVGVDTWFGSRGLSDYPPGFLKKWVKLAKDLTSVFGDRIWVVIPDYCDDLIPGLCGDNVSKTLRNVEEFITIDGVNWLPVIQSKFMNTFSFIESCHRLRDIVGDYPRVAIGTVCKSRKLSWIEYCCRYARKIFPNSWVHAFGLTLSALPRVKDVINSFDSMSWSYDSPSKTLKGNPSWQRRAAKYYDGSWIKHHSEEWRRAYFKAFLERIEEILNNKIDR